MQPISGLPGAAKKSAPENYRTGVKKYAADHAYSVDDQFKNKRKHSTYNRAPLNERDFSI